MPATSAEVLKAIEIFDAMGRDEFFRHFGFSLQKRAKSYFIRHEGQDYDMLAMVRVAHGQDGQVLQGPLGKPNEVARSLKALGFEIAHLDEAGALASLEGGKCWIEQERSERDPSLATEAKRLNASRNGGRIKCEACGFEDREPAMFDAHHKKPLAATSERETQMNDLAVLCPTCHRWAHAKAEDRLHPLPVKEVRRDRCSG